MASKGKARELLESPQFQRLYQVWNEPAHGWSADSDTHAESDGSGVTDAAGAAGDSQG